MALKIKFKKKEAFQEIYKLIANSIDSVNDFIVECNSAVCSTIPTTFEHIGTMVNVTMDDKGNCNPGSYVYESKFKVDKREGVRIDRYIYVDVIELTLTARTATISHSIYEVDYIKNFGNVSLKGVALPFSSLLMHRQQISLN